jgi:GTP-binding protein
VAIVGRSNAGKSSLINGISGARIAQVSASPGKTRLLNFYQAPSYRLVDMPGYGFASRAGDEQKAWRRMIEPYLATRANLVGLLIVMDIRRDWTEDEDNLLEWMRPRALPSAIVLTKSDKLTRSEILKRVKLIREQSGLDDVLVTSVTAKTGVSEVEEFVYAQWIGGWIKR